MDTCNTDEQQADRPLQDSRETRQDNYLNSPMSSYQGAFCVRDKAQSPRDTPMPTGLDTRHGYPAFNPAHHPTLAMHEHFSGYLPNVEDRIPEPGASKPLVRPQPLTWSQPKDNLGYSPTHNQANLCLGAVNIGHAQGRRGEQQTFTWPCSHMPQIMPKSSSLPVRPCDIATNMTTEEPLIYPSNRHGQYLSTSGSLNLLHQQYAPVPTIPPQGYPIHFPCWTGTVKPVAILPKPSVTPQAWSAGLPPSQYPNSLEMFTTASLLAGQGVCQDVHSKVNNTRSEIAPHILFEMLSQFPQKNVIPMKLKVQDDTWTKQMQTIDGGKALKAKKNCQCPICKKILSRPSTLKTHMRIHTGERPYKCPFCSHTFLQASSLQTHKRCHTGEKPFSCNECHQNFSHSSSLRTHMRTHTGERPYHCTWQGCGKTFTDSSTLMKHRYVHTGEKPHTCSDCGVKFTQIGNMRKHWVKQHGAVGENHTGTGSLHVPQDNTSAITSDP